MSSSLRRPKPPWVSEAVPLAPRTTLQLGGSARFFCEARDVNESLRALEWARAESLKSFVLGGGSNLVVADEGFDGLVVHCRLPGLRFRALDEGVTEVTVGAGEDWDDVVQTCVSKGLAGIECMSGIPGSAGATPIQNVGAYGQEVADVVHGVDVIDREGLTPRQFTHEESDFSYRSSRFKREPDRWLVTSVTLRLRSGAEPTLRYRELIRAMDGIANPSLSDAREQVLRLRASKSMVLRDDDPNRRSAGSFFTNPIVTDEEADRVTKLVLDEGIVAQPSEMPRYPATPGHSKLAAAWLIERAGIPRGYRKGAVGVSTKHTLALVHHGGGTTSALLALANEIRARVHDRFGVTLVPEPVFLDVSLPA